MPYSRLLGQTKTKLGNSEVAGAVQQAVGEALSNYLEEHPKEAKQICGERTAQEPHDGWWSAW